MLHFLKNEDEVKIALTFGESNTKLEAFLYTTTEGGKNFYELLKEKKKMELSFLVDGGMLHASYDENSFNLNVNTEIPSIESLSPFNIFLDKDGLGISTTYLGKNPTYPDSQQSATSIEAMEIGYLIFSAPSYNELGFLVIGRMGTNSEESIKFVFALNENQRESTSNYNVDLLFLISSIIIIILLFVCLLSFLTK